MSAQRNHRHFSVPPVLLYIVLLKDVFTCDQLILHFGNFNSSSLSFFHNTIVRISNRLKKIKMFCFEFSFHFSFFVSRGRYLSLIFSLSKLDPKSEQDVEVPRVHPSVTWTMPQNLARSQTARSAVWLLFTTLVLSLLNRAESEPRLELEGRA